MCLSAELAKAPCLAAVMSVCSRGQHQADLVQADASSFHQASLRGGNSGSITLGSYAATRGCGGAVRLAVGSGTSGIGGSLGIASGRSLKSTGGTVDLGVAEGTVASSGSFLSTDGEQRCRRCFRAPTFSSGTACAGNAGEVRVGSRASSTGRGGSIAVSAGSGKQRFWWVYSWSSGSKHRDRRLRIHAKW